MKRNRWISLSMIVCLLMGNTPVAAEELPEETEEPAEQTEQTEVIAEELPEETEEPETPEETEEPETFEELPSEDTDLEYIEMTEEELIPFGETEELNSDSEEITKEIPAEETEELIEEEMLAEEAELLAPVNVFLVLTKAKAYIGTEEIDVSQIEAGKEITLTAVKPAAGYRFTGWKFTDTEDKEVKKTSLNIVSEKDLSITFVVPETPLKISALYAVAGEWKKNSKGWWYEWNGAYLKNTWKLIDGKWYYFGEDGYMKTGWLKKGGKWYWLESSGAMVTGWKTIKEKKYYFDKDGAMQTGWLKLSGKWYRFNDDGDMVTGWKLVNEKWYWFNSEGIMATGWKKLKGVWYLLHTSGAMARGWELWEGKWYFLDRSSGAMKTGWIQDGNKWYYLGSDGAMLSNGWKTIEGKTYYLKAGGAAATGWIKYEGAWYWMDSTGEMITNQMRSISQKTYHFEKDGKMTTGWKTYKSKKYHFDETNGWVTEMYHSGVPYYSQRDGRWGDVQYGAYNPIKNTGCAPTSGTMIVNYLKGTNYTPADIAGLFYQWGDYNASYGHGTGSSCWRKFAKHFGLTFQNSIRYSDMVSALKEGKMMIITVGYDGKYVVGNYTHTMCFHSYDSAGRTYVHDPFNEGNNGWIDAKNLYNRATGLWLDNVDGGPVFAFSN